MTLDEELVAALERDYASAPINVSERVMLDYVVKLTKDATKVWKDDHERLHEWRQLRRFVESAENSAAP